MPTWLYACNQCQLCCLFALNIALYSCIPLLFNLLSITSRSFWPKTENDRGNQCLFYSVETFTCDYIWLSTALSYLSISARLESTDKQTRHLLRNFDQWAKLTTRAQVPGLDRLQSCLSLLGKIDERNKKLNKQNRNLALNR